MPDQRPVLVIDLDGTLLSVNSFRCWASFMLRAPLPGLTRIERARVSIDVAAALAARRLRLVSHAALRGHLQRAWARATAGDAGSAERAFLDELERWVRPELRSTVAAVAAGEVDAILATAAVPEYALALGARLGFRHVVAAPVPQDEEQGIPKRDAVRRILQEAGWQDRRLILLTDHVDDLPLARESVDVYWFGDAAGELAVRAGAPSAAIHPHGAFRPV